MAQRGSPARAAVEHAFAQLLQAFAAGGVALPDAGGSRAGHSTPEQAATLWCEQLLAGEGRDLTAALLPTMPSALAAPVVVFDLDIQLVCPHHLTVAFGRADVAYLPDGALVGFGAISDMLQLACGRLVLQEQASQDAAAAIQAALGARAAVVQMQATHPCHNVTRPRAHRAQVRTWGQVGGAADIAELRAELRNRPKSRNRR